MLAGDKRLTLRIAHEFEDEVVVAVDVFVGFWLVDILDVADGDIGAVWLQGWAIGIILDEFTIVEVEGTAVHGHGYAWSFADCANKWRAGRDVCIGATVLRVAGAVW